MVYIDENGAVLDSVDLTKGFLADVEWIDHPQVQEEGHYEYDELPGGGQLQRYVVDVQYAPAYREVTVQRYTPYTEEELRILNGGNSAPDGRVDALEAKVQEHDDALNALIGGVADA